MGGAPGVNVVSVDYGATSIRVCRIDLDARPVDVDVVHRYAHGPVRCADGTLRWDWQRLIDETIEGLERATTIGPVASIGVDTWAVDYGLLDGDGKLLSAPHSYRSDRTAAYQLTLDRVGSRRFYEICGLQVQPFNTIFQLAAHDPDELAVAAHLLFLPDLVTYALTGEIGTERTNAGSSGLYDHVAHDWSDALIEASGASRGLFGSIVDAPAAAGTWRGIPVHRVGGHDTASAIIALPEASTSTAFVASGTWLLVGRECDRPDLSAEAQADNFTNELGARGGVRFLKNVAGFWLVNECLRAWGVEDGTALLEVTRVVTADVPTFDATDPRFLAPVDMDQEVRDAAGLGLHAGREFVLRCIIESMAQTTADVLARLGDISDVVLVGGGANSELLRDRIEARSGLPVRVGPTEAAAVGNALVQGIAIGVFADLADARRALVP